MKKIILMALLMLFAININAQSDVIRTSVEVAPQFPGGQAALLKYLNENIQYPPQAAANGVEGKVVVQFVIEKDGHVGDVKVVRGIDKDLNAEAIRVCKSLPEFTPGLQNGEPVRVWFTMPVTFKLPTSK